MVYFNPKIYMCKSDPYKIQNSVIGSQIKVGIGWDGHQKYHGGRCWVSKRLHRISTREYVEIGEGARL